MEKETLPFEILPATLGDLPQIREMEKICFPLDAWPLIEQIAVLMLPGLVRLKAVHESKMVGFVGGDIRRSQKEGWIITLAVMPAFRRMGAANELLDRCEREMRMPTVKLCVRKSNLAALALYLKRGYQQTETWARYYDGGEDALVLVKKMPEFES